MNEVQQYIRDLKAKGWTHQAIADELGMTWAGLRNWETGGKPSNAKTALLALGVLLERKPPPKRRYPEGHYMQRAKAERERQERPRAWILYMEGWSFEGLENRPRCPESLYVG